MQEREILIRQLGMQKLAELEAAVDAVTLSPQQVADEISKVASVEDMDESQISEKIGVLIFDAAVKGDRNKTAALLRYL